MIARLAAVAALAVSATVAATTPACAGPIDPGMHYSAVISPQFTTAAKVYVLEGILAWENATNVLIDVSVGEKCNVDNDYTICLYPATDLPAVNGVEDPIGLTYLNHDTQSSRVLLDSNYMASQSSANNYQLTTHELGHALGLPHLLDVGAKSVMHWSVEGATALSCSDKAEFWRVRGWDDDSCPGGGPEVDYGHVSLEKGTF